MRTPLLRESIRNWCVKFSDLFVQGLHHREPRRGSRWHLDEMCVDVGGVKHWLWRAVDEHGTVLDVLLQEHRDTETARTFFGRLLAEHDVPEVIHTDKLRSYGAALRELPVLHVVEHVQVVSTARCNTLVEQRAGVLMGVRSAQDTPTGLPGSRNASSGGSDHDDVRKAFSTCTPGSPIFTIPPALLFPLTTVATPNRLPSRRGGKRYSRWPEVQATCLSKASHFLGSQQLATTG
jgi:transposase-like protein